MAIGEVVLEDLHFLPKINCGMIHMEEKNDHPIHFYKHESRETLIFDETINITIKDKKIVGWIVTTKTCKIEFRNSSGTPKML
jgi:hypothetical protein